MFLYVWIKKPISSCSQICFLRDQRQRLFQETTTIREIFVIIIDNNINFVNYCSFSFF